MILKKVFGLLCLLVTMGTSGGLEEYFGGANDTGRHFPFLALAKDFERRARTLSCVESCLCTNVHDDYLVVDCSLAANGIGLFQELPISTSATKKLRLLITGSELEKLHEKAFSGLEFHKIHIKYNHGLSNIPSKVFEESKKTLEVLDLRNNNFSSFPLRNLSIFENLEFISMDDNLLQEIPNLISNHEKLVHLALGNNKVRQIAPGALMNLPLLKFLDLHGNLLVVLDTPFFGLSSLHSLILSDNPLKTITPGEYRAVNTTTTSISITTNTNNNLSGVLKNLPSLEILDLSFCLLKLLHAGALAIASCKPLYINLARNPISSLEARTFNSGRPNKAD